MATPQDRLRQVIADAQTLSAKGVLSTEESTRLAEMLSEGRTLKTQIEAQKELGDIVDYAGKSAGMLPLAATNGVSVDGIAPAGGATVQIKASGATISEQYGEGALDAASFAATGTNEYRDAFKSYIRKGIGGLKAGELKTLQEGSDSQGGFMVPSDIANFVISREPTPTRVAARATQLQTSRDTLVIPKVNYNADDIYTTGIRSTWTGEIPASSTAMRVTDPVFGQVHVPIYTNMMSIPLTSDMVEDASFAAVSYVSGKFAETIDLLQDQMVIAGTGQGQPAGILANPGADNSQPAVQNMGNPITGDGIVDLGFQLPEQYDDTATFVMNKVSTARTIAKLKDSQNRYLWGAGLQDSGLSVNLRDRTLLGYPVMLSGFMPNVALNAFPIIFGDLRGYYLVNRVGFSVRVLHELYAETNQILVLGRIRFGGLVAEPWKLKIGKQA